MLNRIIIMGRLARDPELRHTQTGTPVASFRLAVDRDFRDKNTGERATDWIDVVAWRGTAAFASKFLAKGRLAVVGGRLQMRDWTDKDGNRRTSAEVVADSVYFGDTRREGGDNASYGGNSSYSGGYNAAPTGGSGGYSAPAAPTAQTICPQGAGLGPHHPGGRGGDHSGAVSHGSAPPGREASGHAGAHRHRRAHAKAHRHTKTHGRARVRQRARPDGLCRGPDPLAGGV